MVARAFVNLLALSLLLPLPKRAHADEVIEGEAIEDGSDFILVPFEVPDGIREIEVRHPPQSEEDVLDYGLFDPFRFRGWGGGNREPMVVGEEAASRSYLPGEMPAGTWTVVIGKALLVDPPVKYSLEIILRTEPTLTPHPERGPYEPVVLPSTGPRWYAGDFHVHSRESGDASATLDEIADLARSRGLDFVEISDHNTNSQVAFLSAAQARHPDVLFIPGVEITTYNGHANGIGIETWIDHRVGLGEVTAETIAAEVNARGGIFSINHPRLDLGDLCIGCRWRHEIPVELIGAVEIGTGAGALLFSQDVSEFWDELSARGARTAAIGGSDDHRAGRATGPFVVRSGARPRWCSRTS